MIPGAKFFFAFGRGKRTFEPVEKMDDVSARAGETLDVGERKLKPNGARE